MLVTKREVRQASKKLLSVLLAVVMIMTSMSVCFGSVAFAAATGVSSAQWNALEDALREGKDTIKGASFSGPQYNYIVDDPDGKIIDVVEAYWAILEGLADKDPSGSSAGNRTSIQVNNTIKTEMQSRLGSDYTNYGIDKFLTGLLAGATDTNGSVKATGATQTSSETKDSSITAPAADYTVRTDAITLTVTMASAVTGYATPDELPPSVVTSKSFKVSHNNNKYDYSNTTRTVQETQGCDKVNVTYYTHKHTYYTYITDVSSVDGASVETQVIKDTADTLEEYKDYFSMDMDGLVAVFDTAVLNTVKTDVATAKQNVVDDFGATVYNHFFSAYNVETLSANIDKAVDIITAAGIAMDLNDLAEAGYGSIITDKAALEALAQDVKTLADKYDAYASDVKAYVESHEYEGETFSRADVTDFYNAILKEIELIEIRVLQATIAAEIVPFLGYNEDNVADRTVSGADLNYAKGTVDGWIGALNTYADANVAEVWEGYDIDGYLAGISANLGHLITVNGYADDFANRYEYYVSAVYANTNLGADSEELLSAVKGYDSWYTGLKALIAEIEAELDADIAEKIFKELDTEMKAHLDSKYNALHERVFAQIDLADKLYKELAGTGDSVQITILNVNTFAAYEKALGHVEVDIYDFLLDTPNFDMPQLTIDEYNEIWGLALEDYHNFVKSGGFDRFQQSFIPDLERPDTEKDIARENEDGVYKTSDAEIEKVIELIDSLLQNDQVKALLGDFINKDKETGEPTGEPFDLAALINGLLEGIYTDELINTIVQYVYPLVAKEFAKVWAGIDPHVVTTADVMSGISADIDTNLALYDVETAIAGVGIYLAPSTLAAHLKSVDEYKGYTDVISILESGTTKTKYDFKNKDDESDDVYTDAWADTNLYTNVLDENGEPVLNDDGTNKTQLNLNWGIENATDKRAAFIDAACAALSGLEPLLFALLSNQHFVNPNTSSKPNDVRGCKIGVSGSPSTASIYGISLDLVLDPITLMFDITGNDGYDNVLAPIFEALGCTDIPHGEELTTTRKILEDGLFGMLDQVIENVAEAPLNYILSVLPNLAYALSVNRITPLLDNLGIEIYYEADAFYSADIPSWASWLTSLLGLPDPVTGAMQGAMKAEEDLNGDGVKEPAPVKINIGEMINLEDMGLDLSFSGIWEMVSGMLPEGITLPEPDAGLLATLGELTWKETNRSKWTYTPLEAGKAAYIEANKADVLVYLLKYVLGSGLIDGLVENPEGIVADLLTALSEKPDTVLAAVVELLNQKEYDTLREFEWFDGFVNGESVVGNSANAIYLNPENDWTEEKADYLYENLDPIVSAVLTMAKLDLDKETPEIDASIGAFIDGAVGGLLSDKTLTALAKLLGSIADINSLIAGEDAAEPLPVDVAALLTEFLGIDLSVYADYADIAEDEIIDFGVDAGTTTFAAALADMLEPLSAVLDFILAGENLVITVEDEAVELVGYDGYNNAIIPLLEALGCDVAVNPENALEAVLTALIGKIEAITKSETPIKDIINLIPGVFYFIASKGLSVSVRNLLQPVYVILDTVRPIYDLDLNATINGLLPEDFGIMLNIDDIGIEFIFDLLKKLVPDLDLSALKDVIYDICNEIGVEYESKSTLQDDWKKGAYSESFSAADLLTVVLSFLFEWATVEDNAKALDEMLGTDGIIAAIGTVFESVELEYGTPDWMYWFETEEEFNSYVEGNTTLPDTLLALEYPNDWSEEAAEYIADNLGSLADMVLGLIEIDGVKYASLSALVGAKLDVFNAETINKIIALITDLLAEVDDNLLSVGYLLDVDLVGLKNYTCTAEINDVKSFAAELASILTTYAGGLVDWLFFGDDFRFAKKSDKTDTIVINGGEGYEKGLALVLEALGCDLPEKATVESVLLALANRVDEILGENMVNEVIDLLPNLIYFLNANGASVAVNNLLAPVYALLDKINGLGILENPIDLAGLLGFDLKYLSLEDILTLVKDKTGLDLAAAEEILVDLCLGKIEKKTYTYKMVVDRKDTVTLILTTALMLVKDEAFAAKLEEMLGTDMISAIKTVFESAPVTYSTPGWYALDGNDVDYDNATVGVIKYAIEYPNNWTEESAEYVAQLLESDEFDKLVAGLIDSSYASLGDLLADKVDIYTPALLETIQKALGDLIGGLDENLKDLVNVGLGAADALLGADVQGLLDYDVSGVKDKETFVAALTGMLMEVEGLVDWLLLGQSYELFVDDKNDNGEYDKGEQIITLNGGHGYAEGLALVLEALGAENLPDVYDMEEIDTEEVVSAVLTAAFDRVDAILADPVAEVFELLPNVLYFINANGLTVAVDNLLGAVNALLIKLEGLGVELDIASLVDFSEILGVETELALDNITMEAVIALVAELTGLNLDKIADVLVGFALGRVAAYDSVSSADITAKMYYHDDFAKYDMITVLATVAIITLTDEANADKVKELLGEDIYQLVLNLINMGEVPVQEFGWLFTDKADTDEVFSVIGAEGFFGSFTYGEIYTEEMGQYIADNFGEFVNNVIYLLGIDINGDGQIEAGLTDLINGLLGGSLYNSANVTAIRDALAGVLENITKLEVNGAVVGGIIADVLKTAGIADIKAVADVKVDEFENDREQFVAALCDVLEPLYGILRYVLADEDISFFVNMEKTDAITLRGAEGYAYGIIPLLETLGCENILTPAEYYAAVEADGGVLLTSILDPLLDRVDAILAGDTAQEILNMLTNLIYFVNSNGVDTVVKNTLNAVYGLLAAIEPIAKIDLYELIGIDLAEIDFDWIMDKLFDALAKAGYEFTMEDIDYVASLTVGKLESFTSANGKTAYRMVYAEGEEIGDKKELVTVVLSLIVTFLTHEQNRKVVLDFLRDELCMSDEARPYVQAVFDFIADCINNTQLGTESVLAALYYVYFGVDVGVDNTAAGKKNLDQLWRDALADLRKENNAAADLIEEILGWDIFEDLIDTDGIAPNGFIRFFQKIIDIFRSIIEWFKNLFNRAEPATV